MLSEDQLSEIESRDRLRFDDIYLLYAHLDYIAEVQNVYGEECPQDVEANLQNDIDRIIKLLEKERESIAEKDARKSLTKIK